MLELCIWAILHCAYRSLPIFVRVDFLVFLAHGNFLRFETNFFGC